MSESVANIYSDQFPLVFGTSSNSKSKPLPEVTKNDSLKMSQSKDLPELPKQSILHPADKAPKRFCCGRLSCCQFVCLNICALLIVLLAVLIPVFYLVLLPNGIKASFDNPPSLTSTPSISIKSVKSIHVEAGLPPLSFLPINANLIGPTKFSVTEDGAQFPFLDFVIPDLTLPLNQNFNLSTDANITIHSLPNILKILGSLSGIASTDAFKINSNWTVHSLGVNVLNSAPVETHIDLTPQVGQMLVKMLKSLVKSSISGLLGKYSKTKLEMLDKISIK